MEHRAEGMGKGRNDAGIFSGQKAAGREKRKEEKDFPVGAAFQPRL